MESSRIRIRGFEQQGAGNGDALFLPAAEGRAALADRRGVAFGETHDEVVGRGSLRGGDDLFVRCVGPAKGDIVADRAGEEIGLLQHDADLPAHGLDGHIADIVAVDQHATAGHIVEARDEVDDAALA